MRPDETLASVLDRFAAQNVETLRLVGVGRPRRRGARAARRAVVPQGRRRRGRCGGCVFHLIEELARHAGQGDVIRESIDGATMYELLAGLEGWPKTDWLTPFTPPTAK